MDKKKCIEKLKSLNEMIEDYLDNLAMAEADEKAEPEKKKEEK